MKIHKILNNNVVVVLDQNGNEKIVCGRGIGFKKRPGSILDKQAINKVFILEGDDNDHIRKILSDIPIEYLEVAHKIVEYAEGILNEKLPINLFISLSDHIYASIQNFLEDITVANALLFDIEQFYQTEYQIGLHALTIIEDDLGVSLPNDEAGFIALHIINVETNGNNLEDIQKIMDLAEEIANIVKYYFMLDESIHSVYYYRFMTHLKFFVKRLIENKQTSMDFDEDIFHTVKNRYKEPYKCVERISRYLKKQYHYDLLDDEKLYLTVHIQRIVQQSNK